MTSPSKAFSKPQPEADVLSAAYLNHLLSLPFTARSAELWLQSAQQLAVLPEVGPASPLFDPMLHLFENIGAFGLVTEAYQLYRLSSMSKTNQDGKLLTALGDSARRMIMRVERSLVHSSTALSDQLAVANFICEYAKANSPYQRQHDLDRMGRLSHLLDGFGQHRQQDKVAPAAPEMLIDLAPYIEKMNSRKGMKNGD